jgi:hypothetical protein
LTFPTSPFLSFTGAPTFGGVFLGAQPGTVSSGFTTSLQQAAPISNLFNLYGDPFSPTCPGFFCR